MAEGFTILRGPDRHIAQQVVEQTGLIEATGPFCKVTPSAFPVPDMSAGQWLNSLVSALQPDPGAMEVRSFYRSNGGIVPVRLGTKPLSVETAFSVHRAGATIVFQKVDSLLPSWHRVARAFEGATGQPVQINLYVGPCDRPGLDWHRDPHDVMVQQLFGEKQFDLAERLEDNKPRGPYNQVLGAGDLLVMSRGTPHRVKNGPKGSVHLSIGFLHLHLGRNQELSRCTDAEQTSITTRCFETMPAVHLQRVTEFLVRWRGTFRQVGDPLVVLLNEEGRFFLKNTDYIEELDQMTAQKLVGSSEAVVEHLCGANHIPGFRTTSDLLAHGWDSP